MKKTILAILICGVMVLGLTGCGKSKNEFDIGSKSDIQISEKNEFDIGSKSDIQISEKDVSLSIKEGTLKNTGATLILKNNSSIDVQYGNPYRIEIKQDGEWHKINVEVSFTLPAFVLRSGETEEFKLNWENVYGKLSNGTYRIIKGIDYEVEEDKYETFNIAAEFTVE